MESGYDRVGRSHRVYFAGSFFLPGLADLCAGDRILPRVFNPFLCRALPPAKRCAPFLGDSARIALAPACRYGHRSL